MNTLVIDPLLTSPREQISITLSDQIEIMFPFYRATPDGRLSARSAMASITLKFDLPTGA